ncbi:MAG: flgL [Actinomycetia bacterium]|nr:flgL [Actinomycetes bacterium]
MTLSAAQRVTQRTMSSKVGKNLQKNSAAMARLQEQLSSGRLISKPSDSPTGTVSALRLRSDIRRADQYKRNADDGIGWLGTADNTLTDMLDTVRRVRDLTLQAANASADSTARMALASEVGQLRDHALALANTTYLGQPLFGGTSSATTAYATDGTYQGNTGTIERTVGDGVSVQVNLPGQTVFGPAGSDLFRVLSDIQTQISNGNTDQLLNVDLGDLDKAFLRVQDNLALVGARYHQVEAMSARAESVQLDATNQLASVESIDLPKTVMDLQLQEVAYQAALGAASRVLQPSLVDFLR